MKHIKKFDKLHESKSSNYTMLTWTIIADEWPEKTSCIIDKAGKIISVIDRLFDKGEYSEYAKAQMSKYGIGGKNHEFVTNAPQSEKELMQMRKEKNLTPEEAVADFLDDSIEKHERVIKKFLGR